MTSRLPEAAVTELAGVGPRKAEQLRRIGIVTVQDLLFHLPLHYQDRTRISPIAELNSGRLALVEGNIRKSQVHHGRRRSLLCPLEDGSGALTLRFFHFSGRQQALLSPGIRLRCFGEVRSGPQGLEMVHPEYRLMGPGQPIFVEDHLTPIYPSTEGLSQTSLRALMTQALGWLEVETALMEWMPEPVQARLKLPSLRDALIYLHRPPPDAAQDQLAAFRHPAQRRLIFDELLAHHLSLRQLRARLRRTPAMRIRSPGELIHRFMDSLPFSLTSAQQRVIAEIQRDLDEGRPMLRLVQGYVGSGKTVIAALSVLQVVEAGFQAAVMAPTELLAEQHLQNFTHWLESFGIEVAWLGGKDRGQLRAATRDRVAQGVAQVVIGTHALFQQGVEFAKLGLVVIDEQHRFGVHQRLALRDKGIIGKCYPHQLIMTATPIPRTLAMTAYADLDCSVIDELPAGRVPVQTVAVPDLRRDEVIERVRHACQNGRQVYWVCTLVEESEAWQCQAAEETALRLTERLPEVAVGLVHGRMKAAEKDEVMCRFKLGEVQLLVATTVIEVGMDVPMATLMIIENAERFGLAQLHQLRGRVGRGAQQSHCVLMYHPPLAQAAKARLAILRETNDGFAISKRDLELRGPGEVLGTRQTGLAQMRIADLIRDQDLAPLIQEVAEPLLVEYPSHCKRLVRRWLGEASRYAEV